jgi:hypothetical protein
VKPLYAKASAKIVAIDSREVMEHAQAVVLGPLARHLVRVIPDRAMTRGIMDEPPAKDELLGGDHHLK